MDDATTLPARQGLKLTFSHEAGNGNWTLVLGGGPPSGCPSFNIVQEYKSRVTCDIGPANNGNEISIIQTVEHSRHEDAALQIWVRNALTISCQRAYDHGHPIELVSHHATVRMREFSLVRILTDVKTSEQVCKREV